MSTFSRIDFGMFENTKLIKLAVFTSLLLGNIRISSFLKINSFRIGCKGEEVLPVCRKHRQSWQIDNRILLLEVVLVHVDPIEVN